MKTAKLLLLPAFLTFTFSSCLKEEDPGPLQNDQRNYVILDFDRIELSDAFVINIQQSPVFSIVAQGDRRNLDDLQVVKVGSTLKIKYNATRQRDHTTFINISMPALPGANLSGASNSTISGFKDMTSMELILSGASMSQMNVEMDQLTINLSGASKLTLSGMANTLTAKVSGASEFHAYALRAASVDANATGASSMNVFASQILKATANGASVIYYKGNPSVNSSASGASTIQEE